jgi:hypothetical protein
VQGTLPGCLRVPVNDGSGGGESEWEALTSSPSKGKLILKQRTVAQLVEALLHKPEGRGFDSRWYHSNFSLT